MLTISKHLVGQVLVDDPPQGWATIGKLRQVVNKNNKNDLFIKETGFSKQITNYLLTKTIKLGYHNINVDESFNCIL
jgi:hypothetical protein